MTAIRPNLLKLLAPLATFGCGLALFLMLNQTRDPELPGSTAAVTGISVVGPDEQALRIGQLPAKGTHHRR